MPDHDALLHLAHLQWGYVTRRQTAARGFSRQLCQHYCRKGSWTRVARALYRIHAVPERPDEALARIHLQACDARGRPVGVVSHHTALYLHGLLELGPEPPHVSVDAPSGPRRLDGARLFPRAIALPWFEDRRSTGAGAPSRRPALPAYDIEDRGCFRLTTPLRAVLDCVAWDVAATDLPAVLDRGLGRGSFEVGAVLDAAGDLLPLHGRRLLAAMRLALQLRARTVERDLALVSDRIDAARHGLTMRSWGS